MPRDIVRISRLVDLAEDGALPPMEEQVAAVEAARQECEEELGGRVRGLREGGALRRLSDAETVVGDPQWDVTDGKLRVTVQGHLTYGEEREEPREERRGRKDGDGDA